jgi:restriction system protein
MFGTSPLIAALVVAVFAMATSSWWFGVHRRRKAETSAGVTALAGMKWRECAGLVLQALAEKGYREAPASRQPGDGGTEFLLVKGDERILLSYKHGTAYRLGEANVRDFANAVQLQGATSGMLVTLGSAEGFARDIARRFGIELIDGRSLWPQVEPFAPAAMVEAIRTQASGLIHRGQRMGIIGSVVLGLLVFVAGMLIQGGPEPDLPPVTPIAGAPASSDATSAASAEPAESAAEPTAEPAEGDAPIAATPAPAVELAADDPLRPEAEASREASAALQELDAINQLSEEERLQRRLSAAAAVAALDQADTAIWMTTSTLVIGMNTADGIDSGLVNDACSVLTQYEELRYSRLQLEPPASDTTGTPVRWRQCQ